MIETIYISHSVGCAGWDMEKIFEGTLFKTGCRTSRFRQGKDDNIKMLDWDFKKPDWDKHLEIVRTHPNLEVVMAPDYFRDTDIKDLIDKVELLKECCKRVVIPIHAFNDKLLDYELAYPNIFSFNPTKKRYWIWNFKDAITHILGGSPLRQFKMSAYFPNLKSVDGNWIFNLAIRFGKYCLQNGKEVGPKNRIYPNGKTYTTKEIFEFSVRNIDAFWKKGEL